MYLNQIQREITNELAEQINKQLNQIIIEGLKLKGHSFNQLEDLKAFITKHCQSATKDGQTTFYIEGIPFLVYAENTKFKYEGSKIIGFEAGQYSFL